MCGITGIAGRSDLALIRRMRSRIRHRGPDEHGEFVDDTVSLAMQRLAIIDIRNSHQPIFNEDATVCVIFNGEIYNYEELRSELIQRGHRFKTHGDTEVIVHLYEEHGERVFEHLLGMFAIAIWDIKNKTLVLGRDRLGEKPLYYAATPRGELVFGSEIKAMLPALSQLRPNNRSIAEYFTLGYVFAPETFYEGISKLGPGESLSWHDGELKLTQYWAPSTKPTFSGSYVEALDQLDEQVNSAVKHSLKADVEVGAFLSGGIDSSLIVAMMRKMGVQVQSFAVGYAGAAAGFNEFDAAKAVAKHCGSEHTEIVLAPKYSIDLLPQIVWHYDEPQAEPTSVLVYLLCEHVSKHLKVALSGTGGDELFFGYPKHRALRFLKAYSHTPSALRNVILPKLAALLPESSTGDHTANRFKRFVNGTHGSTGESYANWTSVMPPQTRQDLLADGLKAELACLGTWNLDAYLGDTQKDIFTRVNELELSGYLPEFQLTYMDRMSMAHSLEVRAPFCDYKLAEFAMRLPAEYRAGLWKGKRILRDVADRYLPASITRRPKSGFESPIGQWFKEDLRPFLLQFLSETQVAETGLLNPRAVTKLVHDHLSGRNNHASLLWSIIALEMWHRMYFELPGFDASSPSDISEIRGAA